jgi:hypothetical protein
LRANSLRGAGEKGISQHVLQPDHSSPRPAESLLFQFHLGPEQAVVAGAAPAVVQPSPFASGSRKHVVAIIVLKVIILFLLLDAVVAAAHKPTAVSATAATAAARVALEPRQRAGEKGESEQRGHEL